MSIARQQVDDVARICAAPANTIRAVNKAIAALPPSQIRPSRLFEAASSSIEDGNLAKIIVREGLFLSSYARRARWSGDEAVAALRNALLAKSDEWTVERIDRHQEHWRLLAGLVENNNIYFAAKAIELSYDHDRILTDARIITDIRPVLDREREDPVGAVVFHSIHLDYYENDRTYEITIALDEDDLKSLIMSCREALLKTQASRRLIANANDDNVFVFGEETYGFTED